MSRRIRFPKRTTMSWVVSFLGLGGLGSCGDPSPSDAERIPNEAANEAPGWNVLMITLDTTRADRLGCYGYSRDPAVSPELDQLAQQAVRFDRAISTSGLTAMAHASILTGMNPYRHGLRVFFGPTGHKLGDDQTTLASVLREHGYRTGAFVSATTASEMFGLDQGFEEFDSGLSKELAGEDHRPDTMKHETFWVRATQTEVQRRADATTDVALEWLQQDDDRPFLAWVHFFDPHDASLIPPDSFVQQFDFDPPEELHEGRVPKHQKLKIYDPEISFMDQQVGRLLQWLQEQGLGDQTIVAILADHGQGLNDHNWFKHRLLYREQIRIPFLLKVPDVEGGRVIDSIVRNIDLMPTVLDALDLGPVPGVEGKSLLSLMRTGQEDEPRLAYAEALNTLDDHTPKGLPEDQKDLLFCVVDEEWKLIYHKERPENSQLYHLAKDPMEQENVADRHPRQVERLIGHLERLGAMEIQIEDRGALDPDLKARLEALGYTADD